MHITGTPSERPAADREGMESAARPAVGRVALGSGLTRLGRPWGVRPTPVPTDDHAARFLAAAVSLGIRLFDTAPSYGTSEQRLGHFLASLDPPLRSTLLVATKFGEQWDAATGTITVDHSFDALARSLDASLQRLGRIDLIQVHRPAPETLGSRDVARACRRARELGVGAIGASVSRVADVAPALHELHVDWLQFPFHVGNDLMREAFALAAEQGVKVLVNRPFGMGALVHDGEAGTIERALAHICAQPFTGAILSGTISPAHLQENLAALQRVQGPATGSPA